MSVYMQYEYKGKLHNCIFPPFVLVGTEHCQQQFTHTRRYPPKHRAEVLFNRIEQAENTAQIHSNAMAYWSLVQQGRVTAQKHARDTMTGRRSVEADVQGGEKPHAAPLEHTDKLAR